MGRRRSKTVREEWQERRAGDVTVRFTAMGDGPPVILLHGLSASVRWWRYNIERLAESFRVYAVDLVHYGGETPGRSFVLSRTAQRLADWMEVLQTEHPAVIGHSMGGFIAADLAAEFPALVGRLVLVNPAVMFPPTPLRLSPTRLVRYAPRFPLSLVPVLVEDALNAGPIALIRSTWDLLASDLREKLSSIQAPTLLVWGRHDGILPVELAPDVCSQIPDCRLKIFERAGHNPMWEEPEEFNDLVCGFLKEGQSDDPGKKTEAPP